MQYSAPELSLVPPMIMPLQRDINQELASDDSHRLILHNSQGLTGGAIENLRTAQEFIKRGAEMVFKDRLHAIWIPFPGGRVFERGDGALPQNPANEVPIIEVWSACAAKEECSRTVAW
ncbi:hypothetical protein BS47DRAFT_274900 [Hydnum rufescens UP504]|uniref:Uncharacterized protein n=1 Tax=Hydnum rufescens UP504 TaxID=1448309 RepID=A0A9P6DQU6_9AGAM|nr:hypothetical protein BS47DRAFT_274900 [Hydnum rufescens UP504]